MTGFFFFMTVFFFFFWKLFPYWMQPTPISCHITFHIISHLNYTISQPLHAHHRLWHPYHTNIMWHHFIWHQTISCPYDRHHMQNHIHITPILHHIKKKHIAPIPHHITPISHQHNITSLSYNITPYPVHITPIYHTDIASLYFCITSHANQTIYQHHTHHHISDQHIVASLLYDITP